MKSELDTAWNMVMSWTPVNRRLSAFFKILLKYNSPQNEDALNWDLYRLSLARMRFLQTHSTHWRATCSYPTHGIDFRDYLLGNFKDFNIFNFVGERQWKKVEYNNIRGHVGTDLTAPFWQEAKYMDIAYRQYPHPQSVQDGDIWCGIKWRQLWLVRRRHQQQIQLPTGRLIHYPVVVWSSPLIFLETQKSFSGSKNCNKVQDPVVFYSSWKKCFFFAHFSSHSSWIKMSSNTKQSGWIQLCVMRKRGVNSAKRCERIWRRERRNKNKGKKPRNCLEKMDERKPLKAVIGTFVL